MSFRTQNTAFMLDFFKENQENKLQDKIQEFVNYRKAKKKPILKESMEAFLKKLTKLGNGNEAAMIEILDNSIANGWQGIFELKQNGKQGNTNSNQASLDELTEKSREFLRNIGSEFG